MLHIWPRLNSQTERTDPLRRCSALWDDTVAIRDATSRTESLGFQISPPDVTAGNFKETLFFDIYYPVAENDLRRLRRAEM